MRRYQFTSESVTEGHPDKVCDQISDAILDGIIAKDPTARVACETMVKTGMAVVAGEITTSAWVDMPVVIRETIKEIGYTDARMGFDWETCAVLTAIEKQSPDISQGVTEGSGLHKEQGAGDQHRQQPGPLETDVVRRRGVVIDQGAAPGAAGRAVPATNRKGAGCEPPAHVADGGRDLASECKFWWLAEGHGFTGIEENAYRQFSLLLVELQE